MRHLRYIALLCTVSAATVLRAQVSFSASSQDVYDEVPAKNTGLDHIYVLRNASGVSMSYTATTGSKVTWYSYGSQGGGYAQEISDISYNGSTSTLAQVAGGTGYIIEEGTSRTYVWVVDYSQHALSLSGISPAAASECGTATLNITGSGDEIPFYTITGVRRTLDRAIKLSYSTLNWNEGSTQWTDSTLTTSLEYLRPAVVVEAPLCNTTFTIAGDRFLEYWGEGVSLTSDLYTTTAVDARATAVQEKEEHDNQISDEGSSETLGGSAPATITFTAYPTDAIVHHEWQMATDPDFKDLQLRLDGDQTVQTFEEAGTTYWRFFGANGDGSCEAYSDTYTVTIGTSDLKCPNVFSPGLKDGVNDVWKVSYKSIVSFKCSIFNRWGVKITSFNDPSQGWDGTYKGKLVDSGVYFYVIQARGSDGRKYNLKGDINIINYNNEKGSSTTTTSGGGERFRPQ